MADQKSLRRIGFGLSAVTALVTLVATLVVADAARNGVERPERHKLSGATLHAGDG